MDAPLILEARSEEITHLRKKIPLVVEWDFFAFSVNRADNPVAVSAYQSARIGLERGRHDFELPAQPAPISKLGLSVVRELLPDNRNEATEPYSGLLPGWDGRQFVSRRWLRLKNDPTVLDSGHDLSIIDVIELAGTPVDYRC